MLNTAIKNKASKQYKDNTDMQRILSADIEAYLIHQDRAFKQCNSCADKMGLTITIVSVSAYSNILSDLATSQ